MDKNRRNAENEQIVIRVSGLTKRYRLGRIGAGTLQGSIKEWKEKRRKHEQKKSRAVFCALNNVSFDVCKGETLGIIGRNGAGKSTLLKILSRITAPTEGTVDLYGRVVSMLEVGTGFHGDMTGRENVYLNGTILGMTKVEIDAKMDDIIQFAGLREFIDTPIKKYSSGMYIKLGFSIAYHLDSEIIIMDEVLAVADYEFQQKCINFLRTAAEDENRTVLYVSHNMSTVKQLCKRCIVLDDGEVVFDGDTNQAIALYMGEDEEMPTHMVYELKHHSDAFVLWKEKLFSIDELSFVNRERPEFTNSEEAVLKLICTAEEVLERVGLRLEFWDQNGVKVATSLSGNFLNFDPGTSIISIRMSLGEFVPGQYRADIIAFFYDGTSAERKLDAVYPGFTFRINASESARDYLEWNHEFWGSVRLADMLLEKDD